MRVQRISGGSIQDGNPIVMILCMHANISSKTLMKLANQMKETKTWKSYEVLKNNR